MEFSLYCSVGSFEIQIFNRHDDDDDDDDDDISPKKEF